MTDDNLTKIRQYEKENILRKRDELISKGLPNSNLSVNDCYILKRIRTLNLRKFKSTLLIYLGVYIAVRMLVWIYDIYAGNLECVIAECFGIGAGLFLMFVVFLSLTKGKFYYKFDGDKFSKYITDNQADAADNLVDSINSVSDKK